MNTNRWGDRNGNGGAKLLLVAKAILLAALLAASSIVASIQPTQQARATEPIAIAHGGLPDPLDHGEEIPGQPMDWDTVFATLRANGVTAFFPSTDSIAEFVTAPDYACNPDSAAFAAMRAHGVQLIVPGYLLYPPGWLTQNETLWNRWFDPGGETTADVALSMPSVPSASSPDDPLQRLIACAGGIERIAAVTSYDEPAFTFDGYDATHRADAPVGIAEVRALYSRVKAASASTPVMMVHAPIPRALPEVEGACVEPPPASIASAPWSFVTPEEWIADYLDRVRQFSVWADWVGFDLYPVPDGEISRIITDPYRAGLEIERYDLAVDAYLGWLAENIDKPRFLVSQGFSYARNAEVASVWCLSNDALRSPTPQELSTMNQRASEQGALLVLYWGIHLLQEDDLGPGGLYETLLSVSSEWGR